MEFGDGSDEEFGLMPDDSGQIGEDDMKPRETKLVLEDIGVEKVTERLR